MSGRQRPGQTRNTLFEVEHISPESFVRTQQVTRTPFCLGKLIPSAFCLRWKRQRGRDIKGEELIRRMIRRDELFPNSLDISYGKHWSSDQWRTNTTCEIKSWTNRIEHEVVSLVPSNFQVNIISWNIADDLELKWYKLINRLKYYDNSLSMFTFITVPKWKRCLSCTKLNSQS